MKHHGTTMKNPSFWFVLSVWKRSILTFLQHLICPNNETYPDHIFNGPPDPSCAYVRFVLAVPAGLRFLSGFQIAIARGDSWKSLYHSFACMGYPLVIWHSYWKLPFIVDSIYPLKVIFHGYVSSPDGTVWKNRVKLQLHSRWSIWIQMCPLFPSVSMQPSCEIHAGSFKSCQHSLSDPIW